METRRERSPADSVGPADLKGQSIHASSFSLPSICILLSLFGIFYGLANWECVGPDLKGQLIDT